MTTDPQPVLLYGAQSALGQVLARRLAEAGFQVCCPVTRQEDATILASSSARRIDPSLLAAMEPEAIKDYIQAIRARFGGLRACILLPPLAEGGSGADGSLDRWEAMFQQDLWAPILVGRAALAAMRGQRPAGGHFIVINPAGRAVVPADPAYCGLGWGLAAFAEAVRLTYTGEAIRVTVLETGPAYPAAAAPPAPADAAVGDALIMALTQPERVSISEIVIQPFAGPTPGSDSDA